MEALKTYCRNATQVTWHHINMSLHSAFVWVDSAIPIQMLWASK